MAEIKDNQKIKTVSIFLTLCGVLLFITGILLLKNGINRVSLQVMSSSFFLWAFAASPQIMFRRVLDKGAVVYSKLSKLLFLGGSLMLIAALIIHFYKQT